MLGPAHSSPGPATHAVDLLTLLSAHATPMRAAAIARELGLPRSTTYRLLSALVRRSYVVHLPEERRYGLGVAAFELGSAYSRSEPLTRIAKPVVAGLADRVDHNAHLAVLHGRDVVYLVEERVAGRPSLVTDVGVRLPASLTASGLAMLAALPSPQVRALYPSADAFVQRHGTGPTSLSELRTRLRRVRDRGYAEEVGLVTPGLSSAAVGVLDHTGYPAAAVAVTFPGETDDGRVTVPPGLLRALQQGAWEIARRLGRRDDRDAPASRRSGSPRDHRASR